MTTILASGSATSDIHSAQRHEMIRNALKPLGERTRDAVCGHCELPNSQVNLICVA